MEKIDRLGWAEGISIEVFGLKIGIRVRDSGALDSVISRGQSLVEVAPDFSRSRPPQHA